MLLLCTGAIEKFEGGFHALHVGFPNVIAVLFDALPVAFGHLVGIVPGDFSVFNDIAVIFIGVGFVPDGHLTIFGSARDFLSVDGRDDDKNEN